MLDLDSNDEVNKTSDSLSKLDLGKSGKYVKDTTLEVVLAPGKNRERESNREPIPESKSKVKETEPKKRIESTYSDNSDSN